MACDVIAQVLSTTLQSLLDKEYAAEISAAATLRSALMQAVLEAENMLTPIVEHSANLLQQLKAEAPQYAKLLPALPRLMQEYLQHRPGDLRREINELVAEQRRTNRLLQYIIYGGIGFLLGLVVTQLLLRIRLW